MPATQSSSMVDGELVTVQRKKKDKKNSGSVSSDILKSSFIALATDPPPPCKICETVIDDGKSIRCDKCVCWVHQDCSNLTKTDFAFLDKASSPSCIKWFCPKCESEDTNNVDQNADKFDRLANLLVSVTMQNTEILSQMRNDRKMTEQKERTFEKSIKLNVSEVLDDRRQKDDRKNCAIMFNIPENTDNDEGKKADIANVKNVIEFVCPDIKTDNLSTKTVTRLGTRTVASTDNLSPRPRPIKITFNEPKSRDSLLKNARKLKDSAFRNVGISADKTKKEREEELQTRKDFTVRKLQGEDIVLYRGQIYDRSEAPWLRRNQKASSPEHEADDDQTEV